MAWGGRPGEPRPGCSIRIDGLDRPRARRLLRAVGDPEARFGEDALRMVRAVRLSAALGFAIEPRRWPAIEARAELVRHLSGERIAAELEKLLAAPSPSVGLRPLESTGLLRWISPELAAQRGIPQNKVPGEDLWDHTLRAVDAAPADRPVVRLAALVHDIGKPATFADGRFIGHETVGAELAGELLLRLRFPRSTIDRVAHLVRQHMFAYESSWGDAAVRRFIAKIGRPALDELFELRRADNVGSGLDAGRRLASTSSGPGSPSSWRPRSRSIGATWRSTATTSSPSSAPCPDRGSAPSSTGCSTRSSRTRPSTTARRSCSSPRPSSPRTPEAARSLHSGRRAEQGGRG